MKRTIGKKQCLNIQLKRFALLLTCFKQQDVKNRFYLLLMVLLGGVPIIKLVKLACTDRAKLKLLSSPILSVCPVS